MKFTFGGQLLFDESFRILFRLGAQFNLVRIIQASGTTPNSALFRALKRRRPEPFGKFFSFRAG